MADYLTTDTELTSVADAIRTKGGTSSPLTFPTGFVSAINDIQPTLTLGAIRPDAVVIAEKTKDEWVVADGGWTKPAYSTKDVTVQNENRFFNEIVDINNYDYFVTMVYFLYPTYNTSAVSKGRQEFLFEHTVVEISPPNTVTAFSNNATANLVSSLQYKERKVDFTWTDDNTFGAYNGLAGFWLTTGSTYVSYNNTYKNLFVRPYTLKFRGNATYFPQTWWDAVTDARLQYELRVWRAPKNSLNYDGWSEAQLLNQVISAINSPSHTLT